ncbi:MULTISPECIES: hypothetical protein [Kamptonema]|uniref:hypothetical protein n=1 Tax=Kamptonema TaxID=1501433 RepID=UPI0002E9DFE3|nr:MULTISPECIES: hypothetical protein [Kamptonema]
MQRVVQNFATMPGVVEIAIVDPSGIGIARSPQNGTNQPYTFIYPQLAQAIDRAATTGVEVSQDIIVDNKPAIAQILPFSSTLFGASQRRGVAIALLLQKNVLQPLQDLNEAVAPNQRNRVSTFAQPAVFLRKYFVLTHRFSQKPGFWDSLRKSY